MKGDILFELNSCFKLTFSLLRGEGEGIFIRKPHRDQQLSAVALELVVVVYLAPSNAQECHDLLDFWKRDDPA
jgi:hypothetical protein